MSAISNSRCPVCRTSEIISRKWTLLVIRGLADGSQRFCELERSLEGISPRTLSLSLPRFDVAGDAGDHPFYRYQPRTADFIAEHEGELHSLPSFGPACGAVTAAKVAAPYLEARGLPVPADDDQRAAKMLVAFVCSLWEG